MPYPQEYGPCRPISPTAGKHELQVVDMLSHSNTAASLHQLPLIWRVNWFCSELIREATPYNQLLCNPPLNVNIIDPSEAQMYLLMYLAWIWIHASCDFSFRVMTVQSHDLPSCMEAYVWVGHIWSSGGSSVGGHVADSSAVGANLVSWLSVQPSDSIAQ